MSLSNKAMLVTLNISQWTGKKIDKKATENVETTYHTERKVGQYTKRLLPSTKEMDDIQRLAGAMRVYFYEQTLPWLSDGSRIISALNYMEFTNKFRKMKQEFDGAVYSFIAQYPALKEQAKAKLGSLYDENDYPHENEIQYSFDVRVAFMPMPDVGDFRTEVLDSEKEEFLKNMRDVESNAVKECWTRLHDVVKKAVNKLNTPDAVFRDSLIENIQDICTLLPKLNVTEDSNLESVRSQLEEVVKGISPNACREIPLVRNEAAKKLEDLTSKMSIFMAG